MIVISQGHKKSIGLEILLKCIPFLNDHFLHQTTLVCSELDLVRTLESINFAYQLKTSKLSIGKKTLSIHFVPDSSNTYDVLLEAINLQPKILITLPTTKADLNGHAGYTEFFRHYFNNPELTMGFCSESINLALLTDHIPLSQVPALISPKLFLNKCKNAINFFLNHQIPISSVAILGINPHAGEEGLLGMDEKNLEVTLKSLQLDYPSIRISGFHPADSFFLSPKDGLDQLIISPYHDQALPIFKRHNGVRGVHYTAGMPFIRLSVDHGTASDLFNLNLANYSGMMFVLDFITRNLIQGET